MPVNFTSPTYRPVICEALLAKSLGPAFELFMDFGRWWPNSHTLGRENSRGINFPRAAGHLICENFADGSQALWGKLTLIEPPLRLLFSWHPGRPATQATQVEVRFAAKAESRTQITLTHSGWEIWAGEPLDWRREYQRGWDFVIGECFAGFCAG